MVLEILSQILLQPRVALLHKLQIRHHARPEVLLLELLPPELCLDDPVYLGVCPRLHQEYPDAYDDAQECQNRVQGDVTRQVDHAIGSCASYVFKCKYAVKI